MKKSCAVKFLAMMLVIAMVMSVSLSAMALTATSTVTYNDDGTAAVLTQASNLDGATMVTYMVTNNKTPATVSDNEILYIGQHNTANDGTTVAAFEHSLSADDVANAKYYVGSDQASTPADSDIVNEKAIVTVNGTKVSASENPAGLEVTSVGAITEVNLGNTSSAIVKTVKINENDAEWFTGDANSIWVVGTFGIGDTIAVTTEGTAPTDEAVVTLGKVTLENNSIIAFAHVKGAYNAAGIEIAGTKYPAVAFGDGAFAVEVVNESGWDTTSDIIVRAYVDGTYSNNSITTVQETDYTYPVENGSVTIKAVAE